MSTPSLRSLCLAALLALGCGGGGGGEETPPPATPPTDTPQTPATPVTPTPPPVTGAIDFVAYARTLIEQDTSDTAKPREFAGLTFTDGEDPNAFLEDYFPQ